ncbi:MAG: Two-component response regulator receiver domain [Candidatus Tokpelaia sp. JSC085]|nr:MAG: Two-component response regulator receiver domain [Candidatus Tokpelaia sp. JSC085]
MKRILLAEDDDDLRRFLAKALERAGYKVMGLTVSVPMNACRKNRFLFS